MNAATRPDVRPAGHAREQLAAEHDDQERRHQRDGLGTTTRVRHVRARARAGSIVPRRDPSLEDQATDDRRPPAITVTCATGDGATSTIGVATAAIRSRGRSGVRRRAIVTTAWATIATAATSSPWMAPATGPDEGTLRIGGHEAEDRHDQRRSGA